MRFKRDVSRSTALGAWVGVQWACIRMRASFALSYCRPIGWHCSGSPFNRTRIMGWFSPGPAVTTRVREVSSTPGSAPTRHAWTAWSGFGGRRGSSAAPAGMQAAGG